MAGSAAEEPFVEAGDFGAGDVLNEGGFGFLAAAGIGHALEAFLLGQLIELAKQERFERMTDASRRQEAESALVQDIARAEVPGFDKWLLRRRARQSVMPFMIDVSSLSMQ